MIVFVIDSIEQKYCGGLDVGGLKATNTGGMTAFNTYFPASIMRLVISLP